MNITEDLNFKKGKGDWNKLADFMDQNNFSCSDMLAVVASHLLRIEETEFNYKLMLLGTVFNFNIKKEERGFNV